jgi:hypothetical protein
VRAVYDATNRLVRRVVPHVSYGATPCATASGSGLSCSYYFPTLSTGGSQVG